MKRVDAKPEGLVMAVATSLILRAVPNPFRVCHRLTGHYSLFTYSLPPKGNCGPFVVRRGGLLWMTSVIMSTAWITG